MSEVIKGEADKVWGFIVNNYLRPFVKDFKVLDEVVSLSDKGYVKRVVEFKIKDSEYLIEKKYER